MSDNYETRDNIRNAIRVAVDALFKTHYPEIREAHLEEESAKCKFTFTVHIEGDHRAPLVKVNWKMSRSMSDEVSQQLSDPDQTQLPFEGDDKE
jgi:hypothetical protein